MPIDKNPKMWYNVKFGPCGMGEARHGPPKQKAPNIQGLSAY